MGPPELVVEEQRAEQSLLRQGEDLPPPDQAEQQELQAELVLDY